MCPITMTAAAGVGGIVAGFVLGRVTKRCGCKSAKDKPSRERKPFERRQSAVRTDSARQPIPAGSVEIYVGNLSYDLAEDQLKAMFAEYGEVASTRIVTNRFNGKSKGFGFVVMPNRAEAEKAIEAYSEKEFMGRRMRVNEAKNTITE